MPPRTLGRKQSLEVDDAQEDRPGVTSRLASPARHQGQRLSAVWTLVRGDGMGIEIRGLRADADMEDAPAVAPFDERLTLRAAGDQKTEDGEQKTDKSGTTHWLWRELFRQSFDQRIPDGSPERLRFHRCRT